MSPRSPIITETHMNRSNWLLSSSLSLCVWLHVSTICETRPYVSLSHFCLSSFSFFLSHLHICMFLSSALVLLSLSQVLSSLSESAFCVFFLHPLSQVLLSLRAMWPGLCSLRRAAVELQGRKFCGLHCGFLCLSVSRLRVTEGLQGSAGSELSLAPVAFDSSIAVSTHKRSSSACLGLCLVLALRRRHRFKGNSCFWICVCVAWPLSWLKSCSCFPAPPQL